MNYQMQGASEFISFGGSTCSNPGRDEHFVPEIPKFIKFL